MPLRLRFSAVAGRDLIEITRYIAERTSDLALAERFGDRLVERCLELTTAPGMGAPYLPRRGCRKIVEGAYQIIYSEEEGTIWVLRIWDGRRGTKPRI